MKIWKGERIVTEDVRERISKRKGKKRDKQRESSGKTNKKKDRGTERITNESKTFEIYLISLPFWHYLKLLHFIPL